MYTVKQAPSTADVDAEKELYWLAGLLEGEGSFMKGPPSSPRQPIVVLPMTDQDVVERAARLFDRAVLSWDRRSAQPRKRVFITTIKGMAAVMVMRTMHPLMGTRRRTQIEAALAAPAPIRLRAMIRDTTCAVEQCRRRVRSRGLCRRHYDSWWKSTRRGRIPRYQVVDVLPRAAGTTSLIVQANDDPRSIAWLAGLLEGEGTFTSMDGYPDICASMCDRDVLGRAAAIMGIPNVWPKDVVRNEDRGWSPAFEIGITGARAAAWMRTLRPWMGLRRSAAIDRALAAYHPIRLTVAPEHCILSGCDDPHRGRGLCHKHYMTWDRDRKAGKAPRITPLR